MFVYGLIDPRTDCLRYIGKTTNLAKRYSRHCNPRRSDRSHRGCWLRGLRNLGLRPNMVVLEEIEEVLVSTVECFWIASLRAAGADLVNACNGGEGGATRTGHISTEQHRANISKARLGLRPDENTREKMRWTAERRAKMETAISTRNPHPKHVNKHGTWSSYALGCRCNACIEFISLRSSPKPKSTVNARRDRSVARRNAANKKRGKITKRRTRALELVLQHGHVSLLMLARDLGLSPSTLAPIMQALVSEGFLRATGKTRLRAYVLAVDCGGAPTGADGIAI